MSLEVGHGETMQVWRRRDARNVGMQEGATRTSGAGVARRAGERASGRGEVCEVDDGLREDGGVVTRGLSQPAAVN